MVKHRVIPTIAIAAALACTTPDADDTPALPDCPEDAALATAPDPTCQASTGFRAFRGELDEIVSPVAGPAWIRVTLDSNGAIAGACAVRGRGIGQWRGRRRVAEALGSDARELRGPACAAGSTLEFNRARATIETIRVIERDCERQSSTPWLLATCLQAQQEQRGEIWVYGDSNRLYRIFVPTAEAASRRTALLACTETIPAEGRRGFPPIGVARVGVDVRPCMRAQGWDEIE